jgi:hypothetical protein
MRSFDEIMIKTVKVKGNLRLNSSSLRVLHLSCGIILNHIGNDDFKSKPTAMTDEYSL